MTGFRWAIAAACIVASAPAHADEFYAVTPSGSAEMMFGQPPTEVVGILSAKCIDFGWTVTTSTGSEVVCEAPMNFGQSLMGTLLMGNSYSTPPRRFFKYNVSAVNGVSRVQASGWMELQMAFGQMRRTDFSGPEFHNSAMNILASAGGQPPVGTTFPNHAYLGVDFEPVQFDRLTHVRVTSVNDGSAAAQAGVQVGDVITSIARKRIREADDLLDATARAARTDSFEVELLRGEQTHKMTVPRVFRARHTEAVVAVAPSQAPPLAPASLAAQPVSVADELAKLVQLRSAGVLSDAEFEQQKAKLLAN